MAGKYIGAGMTIFEAERDQEKVNKSWEAFLQFKSHLNKVAAARDTHGWDSLQCVRARILMDEYIKREKEEDLRDQNAHNGHTLIKQQISRPRIQEQSHQGLSSGKTDVGPICLDYEESIESGWGAGWILPPV